jgi:hypothetical protein
MNTRIDRIKSALIMALHFFKKINGFKKHPEANKPGQ